MRSRDFCMGVRARSLTEQTTPLKQGRWHSRKQLSGEPGAVHLLVLAPAALLTLAACGDDPPGAGDLAEQRTVVPAEAIHILGTSDLVSRIRDLVPGPDGTVWVLNDAPPWFIGFGPDGEVVAAPTTGSGQPAPRRANRWEHGLTLDRLYGIIVPWMLLEIPAHERPPEEELRHALESEFQQVSAEFAEVFPEYAGLQCDSGGRIWLQPYDPEDGVLGYGTVWWRIDPWTDGDEAARIHAVEFPERFTPYRFDHEGVWGVVRDELDVESVAWIELP